MAEEKKKKKRRRRSNGGGGGAVARGLKVLGGVATSTAAGVAVTVVDRKLGEQAGKYARGGMLAAGVLAEVFLPESTAKSVLSNMGKGAAGTLGLKIGEKVVDVLDKQQAQVIAKAKAEAKKETLQAVGEVDNRFQQIAQEMGAEEAA